MPIEVGAPQRHLTSVLPSVLAGTPEASPPKGRWFWLGGHKSMSITVSDVLHHPNGYPWIIPRPECGMRVAIGAAQATDVAHPRIPVTDGMQCLTAPLWLDWYTSPGVLTKSYNPLGALGVVHG